MLLVRDRRLLEGFRAGEAEALKAVYLHYRPRVEGFLRKGFTFTSGPRHLRFRGYSAPYDLEMATQETMSRAFLPQARLSYDGLRPYVDYVLAIARNFVLNELRRNDALVPMGAAEELDGLGEAPQPAELATEPTLEEREVERLLAAFLDRASGQERELFRLRYRDELGQEEAAQRLGLTRIQVRRIEHKLRKRLLEHLQQNGYLAMVSPAILGAGLRSVLL
jgi:RNA polymerase sigma-70 factor (ECF subfamily)